jgi:hypothetical protein
MSISYWEDEAVLEDEESALHDDTISDDDEFAETVVLDEEAPAEEAYKSERSVKDLVGGSSVIFDVDELVAEFEAEAGDSEDPSHRLRKRLEAIAERKRRHDDLEDFDDYDLDV